MKKLFNTSYLLLAAILIIAAFLRLYNITQVPPGLYPDEAMNGNNALEALASGNFKVFYPENNGREGLFMNIQAVSLKIFGNEPWALRVVSSMFGILTVLGVYLLAKELFDKNPKSEILNSKQIQNPNSQNSKRFRISNLEFRVSHGEKIALLSSFFLATSFWHINFSRIGFRAIMAPFFLVWGTYFLLRSLREISNPNESGEPKKSEILNSKFETPIVYACGITTGQAISKLQITNAKGLGFGTSNLGFVSDLGFRASCLAVLAGLLFGLGFHSYIAYRAMSLLILIVLILYWLRNKERGGTSDVLNIDGDIRTSDVQRLRPLIAKKFIVSIILFFISTLIAVAPLAIYFLENPGSFFGRTAQVSVFSSPTPLKDLGVNILKTAGMFNFAGDWNWRHNFAGKPELFWPVGILFLIGIFLGVKSILGTSDVPRDSTSSMSDLQRGSTSQILTPIREEVEPRKVEPRKIETGYLLKFGFYILFFWLILAALPVVISNEGMPHTLRSILMIPPVFILAGVGGIWLYEKLTHNLRLTTYNKKYKLLFVVFCLLLVILIFESYYTYFIEWARNPNVQGALAANYLLIGRELNKLPREMPKYVIVEASGVDVRGIPMPAQTVMFLTNTFTPEKQKEKNIFYVLPEKIPQIPEGAYTSVLK